MITWNHTSLSVLIVIPTNESWWNPVYVNSTLNAISEWNKATQDFSSNYTDYGYLSALRMVPTVSNTVRPGFDVYISWAQKPPNAADEIGLTKTAYIVPTRIITYTNTTLASETTLDYVLNSIDMQNLALHELGHSLGLGHSTYSNDIMYPMLSVNPLAQVQALSTLDLYGVATVFEWMSNSSSPYSPQQSSITLPSNITYQYLPTSEANPSPPSPSSSLIDQLLRFIASGNLGGLPIIIIMIITFIVGFFLGFIIRKFLVIAIIAVVIIVIVSYLGAFNLSLSVLGNLTNQYGLIAIHLAAILISILPLSIGFIIGLILGFIRGSMHAPNPRKEKTEQSTLQPDDKPYNVVVFLT